MTMTTTMMENVLAQIFDKKSFIINQVKKLTDSCAQKLASKLIIAGFTPHDSFPNPNFDENAPSHNDLQKQELISKPLLRPSRDSVSYSSGDCSLYYRPAFTGGKELEKEELISKLLLRPSRDSVSYSRRDCPLYYQPVFTGGKGVNGSSISARTQGPKNDVGCSLNCVAEYADSVNDHQMETDVNKGLNISDGPMTTLVGPNNDGVNSLHSETDARILSMYAAPDTSVARIQRSKSRQKALERRTNSKTAAKSCLSDENRTHHSYNGDSIPKIDFRQGTQEKCPSEANKHNDIIGAASISAEGNDRTGHISRLAKSSCSYKKSSFVNDHANHDSSLEKEDLDGSIPVQPTDDLVLQAGHVNVMEGVNVPDVSLGSDTRKSSIKRKTQDSEGQDNPISGRITRFRSSSQQTSGMSNIAAPRDTENMNFKISIPKGKRDIKVKALEAAKAAKRREEEKENERKKKKEALNLERVRIWKENAIKIELKKKKKYEEQKKKEADAAARKRQWVEEEKMQVSKKRKLVAEAQKNQKLQYEKSRAGKPESEKRHGKNVVNAGNRKGADNMRQNKNTVKNCLQQKDSELRTDKSLASVVQQVVSVSENRDASNDCGVKETVTSILEKSPVKVGHVNSTTQEISYDMSPYQSDDDDDDDEEDDQPTKKFIPSWCSKSRVEMVLPLQQKIDPVKPFPLESFCNMDEVFLARSLQTH